jgi:purine-binding chemotaxis protein CheW
MNYLLMDEGRHIFALNTAEVIEVTGPQNIAPVPGTDPCVAGIFNLRGQAVTAINLRRRLALDQEENDNFHIIIQGDHGFLYSIAVSAVHNAAAGDDARLKQPPASLSPLWQSMVKGALEIEGYFALVLDAASVIHLFDEGTVK